MGRYEFREDIVPADAAVEVWGESLEDLFATSARALCGLMSDPASLAANVSREVEVAADALDLLLVDFLTELLVCKDRDCALFPVAEVRIERDPGGEAGRWRLEAMLQGGIVDPETTRRGIDVKAVTLHGLAVERDGEGWHGRFVVDL